MLANPLKRWFALGSLCVALLLSACGGSTTTSTQPKQLKKITTETEFTEHLRSLMLEHYGKVQAPDYIYAPNADTMASLAPPSGTTADSSMPGTNMQENFSATNVQENGVGEADRIKTDGKYLYIASHKKPELLVYQAAQGNPALISRLKLNTTHSQALKGLYLQDKTLVALASSEADYGWVEPWPIGMGRSYPSRPKSETQVFLLDAQSPEQTQQSLSLQFDGTLISSRKIGSTIYLALRYYPTLPGLVNYPSTEKQAENNRALIQAASLQDLLPDYRVNGQSPVELLNSSDCFLTQYDNADYQPSLVNLIAVSLNNPSATPSSQCFIGDTETLYASTEAIYLATSRYNYEVDKQGNPMYGHDTYDTDIHKFALDGLTIDYRGSGRVPGHLGWYRDLKSFRFSEHQNTLRVITYTGDQANTSPAHLYNLQENDAEQSLDIVGQLPNDTYPAPLGKADEQIYATRFVGDRAYLVTYRLTDPLYILDLSNPANPLPLGELEIAGYSDYLHPVSDTLLLGVGKDAIATGRGDEDRGAWYQGVKLSLIDVSNPQQPVEKQKILLGKRGSETAVSRTHHAFTSLQQGNTLQVALPLSRHETLNHYDSNTSSPSYYYQWTQDELVRLNIDTVNGLMTQLPSVIGTSANNCSLTCFDDYCIIDGRCTSDYWVDDRAVMIDGYVYYLHEDKIFSRNW